MCADVQALWAQLDSLQKRVLTPVQWAGNEAYLAVMEDLENKRHVRLSTAAEHPQQSH